MSNEKQKQELRKLLIECFQAAAEYASEHFTNLTEVQAAAIDSIVEHDDDFDTVLDNMIDEAETGDQLEEATEFYQTFLNAITGEDGNEEELTYTVKMLDEYRINL